MSSTNRFASKLLERDHYAQSDEDVAREVGVETIHEVPVLAPTDVSERFKEDIWRKIDDVS